MSGPVSSPAPKSMPFPPGTVLAGKYRIERIIGEGGMGWVVVAWHLHLEQRVALKFMHVDRAVDRPDAVSRFVREARAAARIQSEHVARVSDVGMLDNGSPYLVMEYLEGEDLERQLTKRGALPVPTAIEYALQACEGLAEAHAAGIIHRDLKPANLFLAKRSDGTVRVKLLDFGISKLLELPGMGQGSSQQVGMTSTQTLMGSPLYMAPEQLRSTKKVDRRADIWSMGIILYEMLSGKSPFHADTLPEVCARIMTEPPEPLRTVKPGIPTGLEAIVSKCLEKEAQRRFPDVGALAMALAPFGSAEVRVQAERVARLARSSAGGGPSLPGIQADDSANAPALAATALSQSGQTNAMFGTAAPLTPARRSPVLPLVAAGGALFVVSAIVVGVLVGMRSRHRAEATALPPPDTTAATATPSASPPQTSAAGASTAPVASTPPSATATATATATSTAVATATGWRPSGKPTATGTTKPASSAKPSSTSSFGGRD